jgi:hypothetical protein
MRSLAIATALVAVLVVVGESGRVSGTICVTPTITDPLSACVAGIALRMLNRDSRCPERDWAGAMQHSGGVEHHAILCSDEVDDSLSHWRLDQRRAGGGQERQSGHCPGGLEPRKSCCAAACTFAAEQCACNTKVVELVRSTFKVDDATAALAVRSACLSTCTLSRKRVPLRRWGSGLFSSSGGSSRPKSRWRPNLWPA